MKKNFLLSTSQKEVFNNLQDVDAGKLIKGIFEYVDTGKNNLEGLLEVVFIPIKQLIDENEKTYQKRCEANRENGLKGGAPKGNQNARKKTKTTENNQSVKKTTENNMTRHNHIHNHNQEKDNKNNRGMGEEEKEGKTTVEKEFEQLWSIYPNKKGKTVAIRKYSLARKQGATYEEVRQGLEHYIEYCEKNNIQKEYIKHGSTWFNQKCWEDDYDDNQNTPDWFNKKIEIQKATFEEKQELEEILKNL